MKRFAVGSLVCLVISAFFYACGLMLQDTWFALMVAEDAWAGTAHPVAVGASAFLAALVVVVVLTLAAGAVYCIGGVVLNNEDGT